MYACGVTPYDTTHLGHARTFLVFDVLARALEAGGTRVRYAQNVTDVDESILQRAARDGVDWRELGRREERWFLEDMRRLGWRRPDVMPHATREIPTMRLLIDRLIRRGRGVIVTAVSCAALVLAHLIYAYMIGIAAVVLFLVGLRPANAAGRAARLGVVAAIALVLSAYFVVPFFVQAGYLNISPYLERAKYDGFGAPAVLGWLAGGDLFDHGRLPILTALFGIGIGAAVLLKCLGDLPADGKNRIQ